MGYHTQQSKHHIYSLSITARSPSLRASSAKIPPLNNLLSSKFNSAKHPPTNCENRSMHSPASSFCGSLPSLPMLKVTLNGSPLPSPLGKPAEVEMPKCFSTVSPSWAWQKSSAVARMLGESVAMMLQSLL